MRIKVFYARTMAKALRDIKLELGPEAVILSTKEIRTGPDKGGKTTGFKVVAATDPPEHDLRSITPAILNQPVAPTPRAEVSAPVLAGLQKELVDRGVDGWLAHKLLEEAAGVLQSADRNDRKALIRSLSDVTGELIHTPCAKDATPEKRVLVFVGPTGVGKTTSLAKLAARLSILKRKKVSLMSLDGYRIGAMEQMRTYAGIMGVPFVAVDRVAELRQAIRQQDQHDFILIDTTGRAPRNAEALKELADALPDPNRSERHLVLSATTKASDLQEIIDRFEICRPDHLLITKVDETSTLGPVLNELVRTRKSISYYTDGQRVPEDLHTVGSDQIIDMILHSN